MPTSTLDVLTILGAVYAFLVVAFLPGYIAGLVRERRRKAVAPLLVAAEEPSAALRAISVTAAKSGDGSANPADAEPSVSVRIFTS